MTQTEHTGPAGSTNKYATVTFCFSHTNFNHQLHKMDLGTGALLEPIFAGRTRIRGMHVQVKLGAGSIVNLKILINYRNNGLH